MFFSTPSFSQLYCGAEVDDNSNGDPFANRTTSTESSQDGAYCINVYFHIVRNTNGQGQPDSKVDFLLNQLAIDYNPHNIFFNWDEEINYIIDNNYYDANFLPTTAVLDEYNSSDGIDILLFPNHLFKWGGLASGVGEGSALLIGGRYMGNLQAIVDTPFISHEMGHILGLFHTFHGTDPNTSDPNACPELVDGSNSQVCGDKIEDTPADKNMLFDVNSATCEWLGSGNDSNGDAYMPLTDNFMAYTDPECMDSFTSLQVYRIKDALDGALPHLQNVQDLNCCAPAAMDGDLYIKDSETDYGIEPNTVTQYMWQSKDIWVRNENDNGLIHQNPEYNDDGTPNYINVRVINRSCEASTGTETLVVNWAKANTSLQYPQYWDGTIENKGGHPLGGELTEVIIPVIPSNSEHIVKVDWPVPNPDNYNNNENPWHFCLLATVISTQDPLTSGYSPSPSVMVRNNNNQAWKNITVVDLKSGFTSATVMVANPSNNQRAFNLEFLVESTEQGKAIYTEAEVSVTMDDDLYEIWERGGNQKTALLETHDVKTRKVEANGALLDNLIFNANEQGLLTLDFNMLIKELTPKNKYSLHVIQKDKVTGEVIGGETFEIYKEIRNSFAAIAGNDAAIDEDQTVTLSPQQINEAATYNWYDPEGNLVYQGTNLMVTAAMAKKYTLEVIANADGFKDYDEVEVSIKPSRILNVSPNPVTQNEININYKLNSVTSAYLMIVDQNSGISQNYILDPNSSATTITLGNYTDGLYTVALVCDSEIMNAYNFIKQ